jgi:hypothetical protein
MGRPNKLVQHTTLVFWRSSGIGYRILMSDASKWFTIKYALSSAVGLTRGKTCATLFEC